MGHIFQLFLLIKEKKKKKLTLRNEFRSTKHANPTHTRSDAQRVILVI